MSRTKKGQHTRKPHKVRAYEGMTKSSVSTRKKTPASFYSHYMDSDAHSPTFGQRVPR